MRARAMAMALTAGLAFVGCEGGNLAQVMAPGNGELQVTVTEGVAPTYSWSDESARSLLVRSSSGEVFWEIEAVDADGFLPPVRHGQTPPGARVVVPSRLLGTGVLHTATVVGVSGGRGDVSFTPSPLTTP